MERCLKKLLLLLCLPLLTACGSVSSRDGSLSASFFGRRIIDTSSYRTPQSLNSYIDRLTADGRDSRQHGIYIETLRGGEPVAMLNDTSEFNPASVLKLATSLAALSKFGPTYRFRTEIRIDGRIRGGELQGDLILLSGGDPAFSIDDARQVGAALRQAGIRRINGQLLVYGEFICNENSSTEVSARVFMRQAKVPIRFGVREEGYDAYHPRGRTILTVESDTLLSIIQYLNAHSVNSMAEILASHVGGPLGIEKFLIEEIGMPRDAVFVSHASGLEINRLTPRDTVNLLRKTIEWLEQRQLSPKSIMAVAGLDAGTLRGRFADKMFAGSVLAKTGTLYSTDAGVAALAGILYTRNRGPLLFAIYDMAEGHHVRQLRSIQDDFVRQLMIECGGPEPLFADEVRSGAPQSRLHLAGSYNTSSDKLVSERFDDGL